jgi:3-hydroxyacyl-CoA dehydrogenase
MPRPIHAVAVLGAGTMGAQIAAHFANASVPALLLDLTADAAREGLARARTLKPNPFFTPESAALIATASFDDGFPRLADVDWIVEAVVEEIAIKRDVLARVDQIRRPGTIASSNTSGIPIAALAEGRSDDFRRHWLGTHFFNPPRYLHLLELIPIADTDPAVLTRVACFADRVLGKGVVVARDVPNFIANRIGIFGAMLALRAVESGRCSIEEMDAITGPAIGRPKSATFRTMDIAGLDVLAHVARNSSIELPALLTAMLERGWLGEKSGQGFYKKTRTSAGVEVHTLDPQTMTYRPRQPARLASLEAVRTIESVEARIRTLFAAREKAGDVLRETLAPTLLYAAAVTPEIATSIDDVDRAMRWGFGWALGPFETIDAIGAREIAAATGPTADIPLLTPLLTGEHTRFREAGLAPAAPDLQILKAAKDRQCVVRANAGASLVDLGDGVLAVEFHSKVNTIGADTVQMLHAGLQEAAANFVALVVGNEAPDFCAGANLMLLLLEAQEGNWDEIDAMVRAFQGVTRALRHAEIPVIVCPAGMTLGGGCELVLHGDRAQGAAESYIGLTEAGVGLVPAGGGAKEMLARSVSHLPDPRADVLPFVQTVFQTIGFASVSTSAADAMRVGFLRDVDRITMNRERLIADAKRFALERVRDGYRPPPVRTNIIVGGAGVLAALDVGAHQAWRAGRISDHDRTIAHALATILAGGTLPHQTMVNEDYLLDLEREAFLRLCGERKTLERMQHTLKTGKPLRN